MLELTPLPPNFHRLGDSAYPLSNHMLVPYRDNGHLTPLQKKFNSIQAITRVDIERAIGLLKSKWRRLHYLEMHDVKKIAEVIVSTCVLHNFVLEKEQYDDDEICLQEDDTPDTNGDENNLQVSSDGDGKRLEIANRLLSRKSR